MIHSVNAGFLQYWYAWIWLPTKVDFSVSQDGKSFADVSTISDDVPDTTSGAFAKSFDATFAPVKARYVRVHAISRLTCPDWHIGAGQKSWIFCDEVVVQ
jgi:hexosaminidase